MKAIFLLTFNYNRLGLTMSLFGGTSDNWYNRKHCQALYRLVMFERSPLSPEFNHLTYGR